jgi:hypothetical protein
MGVAAVVEVSGVLKDIPGRRRGVFAKRFSRRGGETTETIYAVDTKCR